MRYKIFILMFFILLLYLYSSQGFASGDCYEWQVCQITTSGEHTKTSILNDSRIIFSRLDPNWTSEIWLFIKNGLPDQSQLESQLEFQVSNRRKILGLDLDNYQGNENSTEFQSSSSIVIKEWQPQNPEEGIYEKLSYDFVHSFNPEPGAAGVFFHTHQGGSYTIEYVTVPGGVRTQITASGFPMKITVDPQAGLALEKEDNIYHWNGTSLNPITYSPFKETNPSVYGGNCAYQMLVQVNPAAHQIGLLQSGGASVHENIAQGDCNWEADLTNPIVFMHKDDKLRILFESTVINKDPHLTTALNQIFLYKISESTTAHVSCSYENASLPDPGRKGVAFLAGDDPQGDLYYYQFGPPDELKLVATDASAFSKPCLFDYEEGSEAAIAYIAIKNNHTEIAIAFPERDPVEICYLTSDRLIKQGIVASGRIISWLGMIKNYQSDIKPAFQVFAAYHFSGA